MHAASETHSLSIQSALIARFDYAINTLFRRHVSAGLPDCQLVACSKPSFGDYQCNSAMALFKLLPKAAVSSESSAPPKSPLEVAKLIAAEVTRQEDDEQQQQLGEGGGGEAASSSSLKLIERLEVAPPGFINIHINAAVVQRELSKLCRHGVLPPPLHSRRPLNIIVDYSSPNIAKEMHVGNLRSTIIGDALRRLLEFLGHRVLPLNHLGDWGTQFGMLITHLHDEHPDMKRAAAGEGAGAAGGGEAPPIHDLQTFYREAKRRFDSDEAFKARAYQAVVKLQSGEDEDYVRAWRLICDVSRKDFDKIYERLSILPIVERGESFYQSMMQERLADLEARGFLELDEGRRILWPTEDKSAGNLFPLTLEKSGGGFTYDTSDLVALWHRTAVERADWILYVVDAGQSEHFNAVFRAAKRVGYAMPDQRVQHLAFGVVLGEDGKKFRSRSGDTVKITDLLNEGIRRAREKLVEKGRDKELSEQEMEAAQRAIAYGCIKYADLSHNRTNDYTFSFDRMLDDKGNTAVYLLYAYTRIRSIIRKSQLTEQQLADAAAASQREMSLREPEEWKLAKTVCRFTDTLLKMEEQLHLHPMCDFLYELSGAFTEFYDKHYCVERCKETGAVLRVNISRILLCEATARTFEKGFELLGIQPVSKM